MNRFKTITHILALGLGSLAAFAVSPTGQGIIALYPKWSWVFTAIVGAATALGVYHNPKELRPLGN